MYSFSHLEPVCCSMSGSNCCLLTCIWASKEGGQVVWYSHHFQNFPHFVVVHTVKGFDIVNKAVVDVFLELSCFFHDPVDAGSLISGSSAFSNSSLHIWKFSIQMSCSLAWKFEHYLANVKWVQLWSSLNILWHRLSLGLEWKLIFSSPVATAEFSKFAGISSEAL